MDKIDIAIIGAGVVGLAVGSRLAGRERDVFVFERHKAFGQETSSRNSEVIHSGIYYPEGSVKSRLCLEGNRELYSLCWEHNIPHDKIGKLIVAVREDELADLEKLYDRGKAKGIEGIMMLSSGEVRAMEPNVKAVRAVWLPTTGIIDSHSLMEYYFEDLKHRGADVVFDSDVSEIRFNGNEYILTIESSGGSYSVASKAVVNSAGLDADTVARKAGITGEEYELHYCKGDYFRLGNGKNRLVKRLVYPVVRENDVSLGIHVTPDLAGGVRLGPDAEYTGTRDKEYLVDEKKRKDFFEDVKRFIPFVEEEDLSADTSGIRPKLQGPGDKFRDFMITHERDKGYPGLINLVGIESPGLTASPAIAKMVGEMLKGI